MCMLRDGRHVVVYRNGRVHVNSSFGGKCQYRWRVGYGEEVLGVHEACNETVLFYNREAIAVLTLNTKKLVYLFKVPNEYIGALAVSSDRKRVAFQSRTFYDRDHQIVLRFSIHVYCLVTGKCLSKKPSPFRLRNCLAFYGNDRLLIGSWGGTMCEWDIARGACLHMMLKHKKPVSSITLLSGGDMAVSVDEGSQLCVWDLKRRVCVSVYSIADDTRLPYIAPVADPEEFIMVYGWDCMSGHVIISGWNIHTGEYQSDELAVRSEAVVSVYGGGVLIRHVDKNVSFWM